MIYTSAAATTAHDKELLAEAHRRQARLVAGDFDDSNDKELNAPFTFKDGTVVRFVPMPKEITRVLRRFKKPDALPVTALFPIKPKYWNNMRKGWGGGKRAGPSGLLKDHFRCMSASTWDWWRRLLNAIYTSGSQWAFEHWLYTDLIAIEKKDGDDDVDKKRPIQRHGHRQQYVPRRHCPQTCSKPEHEESSQQEPVRLHPWSWPSSRPLHTVQHSN